MENLKAEVFENGLAVLTIDRPKALNACDLEMVSAIRSTVNSWIASEAVKAILLQGAGGRAFCSGGDVKGLNGKLQADPSTSEPQDLVFNEYNLIYELSQCCKPTVSFLHGVTMGFGLGLGTSAKYRIATEKTRFAMPENNIGIFPDVGFSFLASNVLPPGVGRLMALTGCHLLGSADALSSKLASHYANSAKLPDLLSALQSIDLSMDCDADILACIEKFAEDPEEGAGNLTANNALTSSISTVDSLLGARQVLEDAAAADASCWASELLKMMSSGAPLSQAVAWRLALAAEAEVRKDLSEPERLAVALERDFATMGRVIYRADFLEGTRAVLIDKDNSPSWNPCKSSDVTDADVAAATSVLPESERHLGLTSLSWS